MAKKQVEQSYNERIEDIGKMLGNRVNLVKLTEGCMEMKVQDFNELEDGIVSLFETSNKSGLIEIADYINTEH